MATATPYSRTVTFSSPRGKVRQTAAKRTARVLVTKLHARYVHFTRNRSRAH